MTEITHKQAQRYLRAAADGLLRENQRALLDAHLLKCNSCRTEADELSALEVRLKKNFQAKWDTQEGPSRNVMTTIHSRSWRIMMSNRINTGLKTAAGIAALIVLGFFLTYTFTRLRNTPVAANETQNMSGAISKNHRLIAFTSGKDGNLDIYTMYADGSELTNLTNNPAQDMNPVWSPDGKKIAFESDRNGFRQIFLMNVDGSNIVQLANDKADQWIGEPYNLSLNLWSPDGKRLVFSQIVPGQENGMLYIVDANGKNKKALTKEAGKYYSPSWSPDGKHIAFIVLKDNVTRIYSTDADGNNLTEVTKTLPSNETLLPDNYSWSRDAQSISFIASTLIPMLGGAPSLSKWIAYESSLDGNTLVKKTTARSQQIGGYWDGTYFLPDSFQTLSLSSVFTWVSEKGTTTTVNALKNCQKLLDSNTGDTITGYSSYQQSSNGNLVIGAYCPNGDKWLFWANSKGTVRPLLDTPIHVEGTSINAMHLWAPADFVLSPDDKYIAFKIFSHGKTDMYILNVAEALKEPSTQPFKMTMDNGSLYYSPSWQPFIP